MLVYVLTANDDDDDSKNIKRKRERGHYLQNVGHGATDIYTMMMMTKRNFKMSNTLLSLTLSLNLLLFGFTKTSKWRVPSSKAES